MIGFMLKMAWRETRAAWRHFVYFLVCIAVGVGALVAVSLFGANVDQAVTREARSLLGGDLEVQLSHPISSTGRSLMDSLTSRGITTTHLSELVAMAASPDRLSMNLHSTQIIELKAVDPLYPLYGSLGLEPPEGLPAMLRPSDPLCPRQSCFGAVVQESLLIRMKLTLGDKLKIGQALFVITGVIRREPDRTANAFSLGPRVMISQEGLQATALVTLGSRIRERYLLKIPADLPPDPLMYELRGRLAADSARVSGYRDAQPQLKHFLNQLTRYLGLIGLTALFVGGLGVATSIHAFVREKLTTIAILKTMGADSATVIGTYVFQAMILGLAGSLTGLMLGILLQQTLPWVVAGLLASDLLTQLGFSAGLSGASLVPLGKGLVLGVLSTLLFTMWPLLTIREITPAMILRRDVLPYGTSPASSAPTWRRRLSVDRFKGLSALVIGLGLAGLSIWQADSWKIGALFLGGLVAAVLSLAMATWMVLRIIKVWRPPGPLIVRHALANLLRPGSQSVNITIAIGIAVMVVVTVSLVERSLLQQVGEKRPTQSPSFFFIDIQADQVEDFVALLHKQPGHLSPDVTPLVRSRLSALNGQPVKLDATSAEEEKSGKSEGKEERRRNWYLSREYVLTFLRDLPKDNEVVSGVWWEPDQRFPKPLVSIEEDAARHLGLKVGDSLEVDIQGARLTAGVASIRKVEWGNFSTNFYMIFSPGALEGTPITYVATIHVPAAQEIPLQESVVAAFPNVTAINVGDMLETFSRILDRLSLAIRAVALFCVLSGALVMAASLAATRYRRLYESVILKSLGATRSMLAVTFAVEYALLGTIGGVLGTLLASTLSWVVLATVFELSWSLQPAVLVMGCMAAVALSMLVGCLSSFRLLGYPPLSVLRHE
jgi:putative ABC transport system permease protein